MKLFVNRQSELNALKRDFDRPAGSMFVLYGRRRLGKTALLRVFAEQDIPCIYHMADRGVERAALDGLARSMALGLGERTLEAARLNDWYALFEAFDRLRPKDRKTVLILDEYQYLCEAQHALSSMIQKWWDQHWQHQPVMLVLCGSLVSMMHRETLAASSPLYGRRTAQLLLRPLHFRETTHFFENLSPVELLEMWSLTGGVPRYLELASPFSNFIEALDTLVLRPDGPLFPEAELLLQSEVRKPNLYSDLLKVIASGAHRISEIGGRLGMQANMITRYLAVLQDLDLIIRDVPVTEPHPHRSKKGIYRLKDPFLNLWYGCLAPWRQLLELGQREPLLARIKVPLRHHQAWSFERICLEYLMLHAVDWGLTRIGRYWDRRGEIDLVGLDERGRVAFAGECKWQEKPLGEGALIRLREKVSSLWPTTSPKLALFSRSGFDESLRIKARQEGVALLIPEDLFR